MPPIALPLIRDEVKNVVRYPPAPPSTPPTLQDMAHGIILRNEVWSARQINVANDEELVETDQYKTAVMASAQGAEPAWFAAAITRSLAEALAEALAPIQEDLNLLNQKATRLETRLQRLETSHAQGWRIAAKAWNRGAGSGPGAVLEIVPFKSGEDPSQAPHSLPALSSVGEVAALSTQHRDRYYRGYYPDGRMPPAAERNPAILKALGVML